MATENEKIIFHREPAEGEKITLARDESEPGKILFTMPKPPTFDSFEDERRHRKQRLVAAFRIFSKLGLDEGVAGHLTCRDPEHTELFWVNPFGRNFGCLTIKDLILVNHEGTVVYGRRPVNAAAFVIHSKIHAARSDAVAACHSHSIYGKAFSSLGKPLLPITQDSCMFYNDHAVFPGFNGVVVDEVEGERMAEVLGTKKALILQNHGLLTVGSTVDEAAFWFIALDKSCHAQLLAEAAGTPLLISDEVAADSYLTVGNPLSGWFNFQPYYEMIVKEQPDILDVDEEDGKLVL
ncbi:class II aldolase/adducin-like protein [Martensiomyces pterosporus]|nr:class II aldolase/adducin-like protein [Martensiomyces pterosporus]